jgi:formylglycine-generating enzyme required for sulfatase activity
MCVWILLCGAFAACSKNDNASGVERNDDSSVVKRNDNSSVAERDDSMVWVRPGTFTMGSPAEEVDRDEDETRHAVALTKGFYMGKYQVTQGLYQAVMGANPSEFTTPVESETSTAKRPVERVSWYDALVFCNTLSMLSNLTPVYKINGSTDTSRWGEVPTSDNAAWDAVVMVSDANGYRLPTEAEWEYACRAGTSTPFSTGNTITADQANYNGNAPYNGNAAGENLERTTEAGIYAPNAWGLYDMHGNVWEWCWDMYGSYGSGTVTDPTGAAAGSFRVGRGGAWSNGARILRSAYRDRNSPTARSFYLGFRVVRS